MKLRGHLKIAHHIPGRIRLRFATKLVGDPALGALTGNSGDWLKRLLGIESLPPIDGRAILENPTMVPGLKHVRLNLPGRVIVVEYDPAIWRPVWLDELFTNGDAKRVQSVLKTLAEKLVAAFD
jgi:hypothetical protein